MESPVTIVKSALNPGTILKWVVGILVVFAMADALGITNYFIYPWTSFKEKFMPGK